MNTDQAVTEIADEEGWRERPYRDSLGYLSIGFGFLIDDRKSTAMPKSIGELWLRLIVEERTEALKVALPWFEGQPDEVQRALVGMAYQLGVGGVLRFKRMLAALQEGDRQEAAIEALDSTWFRQTPARAERVARLLAGTVT